jgi:DNA-nicking Smr family endonuclease
MNAFSAPEDDLARQDREFLAAMAGGDSLAADASIERAAAEQAERDRSEFLAYLAAHPPTKRGTATPQPRRRTASLGLLWRRAADPEWLPDAQLDLHGRTRTAAKPALERFITWSLAEALTDVLIVVGQGHHSPAGEAVVGSSVREWLDERGLPWLSAPPRLGGRGALLVSLSPPSR